MKLVEAIKYKKQVKEIYLSSFPKSERMPLCVLFHQSKKESDTFYAALENDEIIGFAYTIKYKKIVYIYYFAVAKDYRGKGYGKEILRLIKEENPDCVITLSIEDTADTTAENHEERLKRLKFYETNGYKPLNIKVREGSGVLFELLGTETTVTKEDFLEIRHAYLGPILLNLFYKSTKFE